MDLAGGTRIGKADLGQARALLDRARNELEPRRWELLDRRLTAAEQAFERFSTAAKASGQVAEVARGAEEFAQLRRARTFAGSLSQVGPLLAGLTLLWPFNTAAPEIDGRPPWLDAQWEFEARLRDVSVASRQLMEELEAQPRTGSAPVPGASPRKQTASAVPQDEDPRCKPIPLPRHLGGNVPHNDCADKMPGNSFPGGDVYVNGKNFDALQLATRTLWDVKTDDFGRHSPRSQDFLARVKLPELQREDGLARQCGYKFIVGVKSAAHKRVLFELDRNLEVIVMDWC